MKVSSINHDQYSDPNRYTFLNVCYQFEKKVKLLRHYRVSEAFNSVHPIGYPISHSTQFGFIGPILPRGVDSRRLWRLLS